VDAADIQAVMQDPGPSANPSEPAPPSGIDLLTLFWRGGAFMIPIGLMSLLVVALAFERLLTLRPRKIIPALLIEDLQELTEPIHRFNPTAAYQSCVDQPSPAARVIAAMLMRTGQPLSDIERAAAETIDREADRYAAPIRWLTLAAAATPMMGLLGTVWGMILAFHESSTLTPDRSRSEQLAEGIYTALVTTLAGLMVAIPAAMLALYLENRLAKMFHRVEELAFKVSPGLVRYTGHRRMDANGVLHPIDSPLPPPAEVPPPPPPPPPPAKKRRDEAKAG
jgi:biopolymer transport protein ExbB